MTPTYYDVSRTLNAQTYIWPGTKPFRLDEDYSQSQGDSVNVGHLSMGIHTGTHVDAPYHFDSGGDKGADLLLEPYWGLAQVVSVDKTEGSLQPEDLVGVDLSLAPRLLLHTQASGLPPDRFPKQIVYPSAALAAHLSQAGIILFGTDAPSVDAVTDKDLPGHHALQQHSIAILEGLDLSGVPDGIYELAALPLKIERGDGSPVRAVLRSLD